MLCAGGAQARLAAHLPMMSGIAAAIAVDRGASAVQTARAGHRLQGLQPRRQQAPSRLSDGCHGDGSSDLPLVLRERDDLLARLVCVLRIPAAIPPVWATVVVPSPWRTRRARFVSSARGATLAVNACQRDPSAAHVAQPV